MSNLKTCRYGKNCDRVKNGTCMFYHSRCIYGANCHYLANQNCGFYHTNREYKESSNRELTLTQMKTTNASHKVNKLLTVPKLNGVADFNFSLDLFSDSYANFRRKPFAEGACRYAYAGLMNKDDVKHNRYRGDKIVIKKWKTEHVFNKDFWNRDLKCYRVATYLINIWNKMKITHATYNLCTPTMQICSKSSGSMLVDDELALNEWCIVEKYLPGTFIKWNSNSGYVRDEQMSIHAFCHWTYHQSNGKYVMCDAQGTKTKTSSGWYYNITDPCICSKDQCYGATDVGVSGILSFFANHKCNTFCQKWNKPSFIDPKKLLLKRMTSTYQWNAQKQKTCVIPSAIYEI